MVKGRVVGGGVRLIMRLASVHLLSFSFPSFFLPFFACEREREIGIPVFAFFLSFSPFGYICEICFG